MPEPMPEPRLFDERSYELVRRLARYIVRNRAIEDEIVQETCLKLEANFRKEYEQHANSVFYANRLRKEWLTRAHLRRVLYTVRIDYYWRDEKFAGHEFIDRPEADNREVANLPPACIMELRLELVLMDATTKPHEVLVYAYSRYLSWKPDAIVRKLHNLSFSDVANRLVDECAGVWDIPRDYLR